MSRILDAVCGAPWLITPEKLDQICDIVTRTHIRDLDIEAVEKMKARRLDNTEQARVRDGIGIINVIGPIVRRADFFSDISGATSIDTIARDFNAALADPNIHSILFNIDSPGGEANGINEFAEMVYEARSVKPIEAYVGFLGASAAYWIASAASRITIDDGAILGSVGTVMTVSIKEDRNKREYVSYRSPNKRPNPNTESGSAKNQALVDALGDLIIEKVARNRGITPDQVVNDFDQGGLLVGGAAVKARAADKLGSFEGVLAEMGASQKSKSRSVYAAAGQDGSIEHSQEQDMKLSDVIDTLKAKFGHEEKPATAAEPAPEPETKVEEQPKAETPDPSAGQLAEMEAQLAAAELQRRELLTQQAAISAENFVNAQILEARVFSAQKDSLLALFSQSAADDIAHPIAGHSRVKSLEDSILARPKHRLLEEVADATKLAVLPSGPAQAGEMSEARRNELLSKTDVGKAALALVKD